MLLYGWRNSRRQAEFASRTASIFRRRSVFGDELLPIGERQLKNIAEPVMVWRWQPPGVTDGVGSNPCARTLKRPVHGRQILDPKVTELLVDLYVRSARLAISESFDEMLAEPDGGGLPVAGGHL